MSEAMNALELAEVLDRRVPIYNGVPTILQAAAMLRNQEAEIKRLREALKRIVRCNNNPAAAPTIARVALGETK